MKKATPRTGPIPKQLKAYLKEYFSKRSTVEQKMTEYIMANNNVAISKSGCKSLMRSLQKNPKRWVLSYTFDTVIEFELSDCAGTAISGQWYEFITNSESKSAAKLPN